MCHDVVEKDCQALASSCPFPPSVSLLCLTLSPLSLSSTRTHHFLLRLRAARAADAVCCVLWWWWSSCCGACHSTLSCLSLYCGLERSDNTTFDVYQWHQPAFVSVLPPRRLLWDQGVLVAVLMVSVLVCV